MGKPIGEQMRPQEATVVTKLALKGHPDKAIELIGIFGLGPFRSLNPEEISIEELVSKKLSRLPAQKTRLRLLPKFSRALQIVQPFIKGESRKVHKPIFFVENLKGLIDTLHHSPYWVEWESIGNSVTFVTKKMLEDPVIEHDDLILALRINKKKSAVEIFMAHSGWIGTWSKYDYFDTKKQTYHPKDSIFSWTVVPRVDHIKNKMSYDLTLEVSMDWTQKTPIAQSQFLPENLKMDHSNHCSCKVPKLLQFLTNKSKDIARNLFNNDQMVSVQGPSDFKELLEHHFEATITMESGDLHFVHPADGKKVRYHFRPHGKHGFPLWLHQI